MLLSSINQRSLAARQEVVCLLLLTAMLGKTDFGFIIQKLLYISFGRQPSASHLTDFGKESSSKPNVVIVLIVGYEALASFRRHYVFF